MAHTRPLYGSRVSFGRLLVALLLLSGSGGGMPGLVSAQQQQVSYDQDAYDDALPRGKSTWVEPVRKEAVEQNGRVEAVDKNIRNKNKNSNDKRNNGYASPSSDVRAIATLAPPLGGQPSKGVRAPPALRPANGASTTGGLSSRHPARSLQDWEVEDIVLLATVDGTIYARDRKTGDERWMLQAETPMVETIYHQRNTTDADGTVRKASAKDDFLWIIEPSLDGSLYGYKPQFGMQKLRLTVKQLVEGLSPWVNDDPPVVYNAEKRTTLFTVDASTGNILKVFSAGNSSVFDQGKCRQVGGLDSLDDEECGQTRTLNLGRTEFKVSISTKDGEPICTINYFEWSPNNRDKDLASQYSTAKDNRYVYSMHDGNILALDHLEGEGSPDSEFNKRPIYHQKLASPVVRVFDVARPLYPSTVDIPLILLPQPIVPAFSYSSPEKDPQSLVFVNCTSGGGWYALSEETYPGVTQRATAAQCSWDDGIWSNMEQMDWSAEAQLKAALVGVHSLSAEDSTSRDQQQITGTDDYWRLDPIPGEQQQQLGYEELPTLPPAQSLFQQWMNTLQAPTLFTLLCVVAVGWGLWKRQLADVSKRTIKSNESTQAELFSKEDNITVGLTESEPYTQVAKSVRFQEDSEEARQGPQASEEPTLFPQPGSDGAKDDVQGDEATAPKKGKAHRGKRGGKRAAEKRNGRQTDDQVEPGQNGVDGVMQVGQNVSVTPDVVNTKDETTTDDGPGLQNLLIHTDKVLGTGSGGTFVYEGEFEGRQVAVKRMLPEFYELASQEVSLLEQSEDHPNVIRYFCRRQDKNFLYIALELCQSSIWDLFRDGRDRGPFDPKHTELVASIKQQPVKVLRQLAEGLKYLHRFRIVHRDIKPQNMLIAYPKKNNLDAFPRFVISDFGLCKTLPDDASTLIGTTGNAGTAGWKAPELINQPRDISPINGSQNSFTKENMNGDGIGGSYGVKRACDVFSLGCVFFYVITDGLHPFDDDEGWMALRERNIKTNRFNLAAIEMHGADTTDLIQWMLSPKPEDRPTAAEVLAHPFFWDAEDRLEFLSLASDRFDMEPRDGSSEALAELEAHADDIIGPAPRGVTLSSQPLYSQAHVRSSSHGSGPPTGYSMSLDIPERNFLAMLDKKFIDTLGKQRKYNGAKLVDLLRALRNKHHHWDDMPDDVKAKVGEVPEGYLAYWEKRFPGLVVGVWRTVKELGMGKERRFLRFFGGRGG